MYYKNPIELNQSVLGFHDYYLITFNTIIFVSIVNVNSHFILEKTNIFYNPNHESIIAHFFDIKIL